jgi:hypothetical protein
MSKEVNEFRQALERVVVGGGGIDEPIGHVPIVIGDLLR